MDKVNLENILFVNKYVNNLLPPIFNDWFTFVSAQHAYQTSSLTKEKLFRPLFKTFMVKILLYPALFSHKIMYNKR